MLSAIYGTRNLSFRKFENLCFRVNQSLLKKSLMVQSWYDLQLQLWLLLFKCELWLVGVTFVSVASLLLSNQTGTFAVVMTSLLRGLLNLLATITT